MKILSDLGEFGLIERIRAFPECTDIGDDCAIIPRDGQDGIEISRGDKNRNERIFDLISTDMLLEGSHFRLDWISPEELGYKSLAVNVSDIAAMGGTPKRVFLSLGLPSDTPLEWIDRFFEGFLELAREHKITLSGGDTTKSLQGVVINVAVTGSVSEDEVLLRSGAKPGELVAVLGNLGDSGAGLRWLMENGPSDKNLSLEIQKCVHAHRHPMLFMKEARWLAQSGKIGAMLDLSDGLLSDARHIAEESGVKVVIDIEKVPLTDSLLRISEQQGWSAEELALSAGEDYGLLFTIDGESAETLTHEYSKQFSTPLHVIGHITELAGEKIELLKNGKLYTLAGGITRGFDHFQP